MARSKLNFISEAKLKCYGIVSTLPAYALMSVINKIFLFNFEAIEDWCVDNAQDRVVSRFQRFVALDESELPLAFCIENKEYNNLLFKKVKDANFIFCFEEHRDIDLSKIKNTEGVNLIYPIDKKLNEGIEVLWESSF